MKFAIKTFGCQMNYSDSERIGEVLGKIGFQKTENFDEANLVIGNTCSVRQKSEDKAFGFLRNIKKESPKTIIAVTGCMVRQTGIKGESKDKLLQHDVIDAVFRIEDLAKLPKILENFFKGKIKESMPECGESYFSIFPDTQNKVQVCVPIMTGCDKFCAYCIVPHTRGREVSRTMDEIFAECEKHVVAGAREITLLGQNVNSYTDGGRSSGKKCFPELLKRLDTLADKGLSRLRFTSPHPQDFNEDLIDVLAEMKTACPYIHLPVQHGSDRVLKAMNRHYTAADFEKIIKEVRKKIPNCTFSTDIIVGFPGETEKEFQELCEFAKRVKFDFSYTAIFSPRRGTPAAEMEGEFIDMKTKKRRFAEFDEIVKDIAFARRKEFVGKTLEVLVEKVEELENGNYLASGRSREFFEVWFESGRDWLGEIVEVEVTAQKYYVLHGKLK